MRRAYIPITTPCGADWNTMKPAEARARLCSAWWGNSGGFGGEGAYQLPNDDGDAGTVNHRGRKPAEPVIDDGGVTDASATDAANDASTTDADNE